MGQDQGQEAQAEDERERPSKHTRRRGQEDAEPAAPDNRKAYRQEIYQLLKSGRVYVLDPNKKYTPQPKAQAVASLAQEYGLR